jgi:putative ABC transport system permease protein
MNFLRRCYRLFRQEKLDADMAEEMRAHLELQAEENRARGMSADEARYAAQRQFGHVAGIQETCRDQRGWIWLDQALQDFRYAMRTLAKQPGYAAIVVLTLAFGIAVNTQIFGLVSTFFLQPLAVRDSNRLTAVLERSAAFNLPHGLSFLDFQDLRAGSKALTDHVAYFVTPAHLSIPGQTPERLWVQAVTPDAFDKLGVTMALGRPLQPSDGEMPPGVPVAVLTHRTWQNRFGGDPAVIGRTLLLNGKPFTIVGVAKPGFDGFSWAVSVSLFVPTGVFPQFRADGAAFFQFRSATAWNVLAYRRPGSTLAEANAELAVFAARFAKDFPDDHPRTTFQALPEQRARPEPSVSDFIPIFAVLFAGLVALVLLIACANVANLMSARALNREKELVVRAALGATRGRLIRQLLLESVVLAIPAGAVGYVLATSTAGLFTQFIPNGDIPIRLQPPPAWQLWTFTVVISLFVAVVSGLMPALRSSRIDVNEGLKTGAGRQIGRLRPRWRNLLVIAQVAVSCVVLICAGLFLRGLRSAHDLKLGFSPDRLIMLSVDLALQGYDQERGLRFQKQLLERVRALPGVEAASFAQHVPFGTNILIRDLYPDNPTGHVPEGHMTMALSNVHPGFVSMLGIPLLRGRDLLETDDAKSPPVAVINEAMANTFWPGRSGVGEHFRLWRGGPAIEVVGVTPTAKYVMLTEEAKPYFYLPLAQNYGMPATLVVRAANAPAGLAHSLRETVRALDADLPIYGLVTMDEHLAGSVFALMPLRMGATMAAVQGVLALLLAISGLFAVVSYSVSSRTREIGVRMALGATGTDILRLVSREGMRLTCIGAGIGLLLALGAAVGLSHVLFGVKQFDPVIFPAVVALLCFTAGAACIWPARRATKVHPMIALRSE